MSFLTLEPEASGALVPDAQGEILFDTWLGDDLVRAYPALLARTALKQALLSLDRPSGFSFSRARIRASPFFRRHTPGKRLPVFWAVRVDGKCGRDDMALTPAGVLVVSRRVLDVLLGFRIGRSVMAQFVPPSGETPSSKQPRLRSGAP